MLSNDQVRKYILSKGVPEPHLRQDDQGLHLHFSNQKKPSITVQINPYQVGVYFSTGNAFEEIYDKESETDVQKWLTSLLDAYIDKGGLIEEYFRRQNLYMVRLTIGEWQEDYLIKAAIFGRKRIEKTIIPTGV